MGLLVYGFFGFLLNLGSAAVHSDVEVTFISVCVHALLVWVIASALPGVSQQS